MTELTRSPLHELHKTGTIAFGEVDGWEMPKVFENIKMEYLAAKGTVGVMDRSHMGRLLVSGKNRFDLLNRLTTNDLRSIESGQGAVTALLTDKGRIVDSLFLHARDDDFYLVTSPGNQQRVKELIEKVRFRDEVVLEDVTSTTAMISLLGPQSAHLLDAATSVKNNGDLPLHHCEPRVIAAAGVTVARIEDVGGAGFNLICEAGDAPAVWNGLFAQGAPYGISPCGDEAYEMLRVEFGLPRFGRELTEDYNPLEARLDDAINWNKGCYIGQEVVARLDSRDKVVKRLMGLWLEPGPPPESGSTIEADGQTVGHVTSATPSLDFRKVLALAYVRREMAEPGTKVAVLSDGDRLEAEVSDLPFKKG